MTPALPARRSRPKPPNPLNKRTSNLRSETLATETAAPAQAGHPTEEIVRDRLYIGGEWVEPTGSGTIDVIDSTTEQVIGRIPEGTPEDIDRAVEVARAGFEAWRQVPVESR